MYYKMDIVCWQCDHNMRRRLEVELDDKTKQSIDKFARSNGMRLPFAYGKLLKTGLKTILEDEKE